MYPTWIKICATTCIEDALAAIGAGADALGFVFAPSKRRITMEQARQITAKLPGNIERIGVFVDERADRVAEAVEQAGLTGVQLHGDETPALIRELREKLSRPHPIKIIQSVLVNDHFETRFREAGRDGNGVDFILLDSGGGTGRTFDWQRVQSLAQGSRKRLIVAGGLHAGNVGEAMRRFSPWGVDVVSGVEREPGRKDPDKLEAFIAAVRKAEQS